MSAPIPSTTYEWHDFKVEVRHDTGTSIIHTAARDIVSLVQTIINAENCPERAIVKIERKVRRKKKGPL